MDNRKHPRFRTRFDTLCSSGREEGVGVLMDISYSGAHLEETSLRPPVGTEVRLYVFVQPVSPFELVGQVVRHTETGFAIEYSVETSENWRLVDEAAAIVAAPRPHTPGQLGVSPREDEEARPRPSGNTFKTDGPEESERAMAQSMTISEQVERQAQRLRTELRKLPLVKRLEKPGQRAARGVVQQLDSLLDRLPIATKRRVERAERRLTELARKVGKLEKASAA